MKKNHFQNSETTWWAIIVIAMSLPIALFDFDMASWVFGLQSGFLILAGILLLYSIFAARRIPRIDYNTAADVEQAHAADRKGMWLTGIGVTAVSVLLVFVLYQLPVKSVSATAAGFMLAGIVETALFSLVTSLVWKRFILSGHNHEQGESCD